MNSTTSCHSLVMTILVTRRQDFYASAEKLKEFELSVPSQLATRFAANFSFSRKEPTGFNGIDLEVKITLPYRFVVILFLSVLLLIAVVAWWLYGNPEDKIRTTLRNGAQAIVNHDYPSAIKVLSPEYRDRSGLTFRDLQRMLLNWCRNKQNRLWLQEFSIEQVAIIDFWRAASLLKVQGIVSVEGFGTVSFGPIDLSVTLERTWWGRWRVTSLDGWQDEPNIQQLIE